MARVVTGVDVGLRTAKFLRGSWKGNTLKLTGFAATPVASKDDRRGLGRPSRASSRRTRASASPAAT
jgi:hypothetical protein